MLPLLGLIPVKVGKNGLGSKYIFAVIPVGISVNVVVIGLSGSGPDNAPVVELYVIPDGTFVAVSDPFINTNILLPEPRYLYCAFVDVLSDGIPIVSCPDLIGSLMSYKFGLPWNV